MKLPVATCPGHNRQLVEKEGRSCDDRRVVDRRVLRAGRVHRSQVSAVAPTGARRSATAAVTPRAQLYPRSTMRSYDGRCRRGGAVRRDRRQAHAPVCRGAGEHRPPLSRQGHPKFWGRITGTSADAESAEWLVAKFKAAGLSDVRIQPLDLVPQWMPQTWDVVVTGGGKDGGLDSAQPVYGANALPAGVSISKPCTSGLAARPTSPARTSRARPCSSSTVGLQNEGAVRRADAKGAAVIFEVNMLPGNMRYQAYPSGTKAPAFTVGSDDGYAARELIAAMPAGQSRASRRSSRCSGCRT